MDHKKHKESFSVFYRIHINVSIDNVFLLSTKKELSYIFRTIITVTSTSSAARIVSVTEPAEVTEKRKNINYHYQTLFYETLSGQRAIEQYQSMNMLKISWTKP